MTRVSMEFGRAIAFSCLLVVPGFASAGSYAEGPVARGGSVSGKVRFTGSVPAPEMQKINKDMAVCGGDHRMHETVRTGEGAGLADVVVVLEGIAEGKAWQADVATPELLQQDCAFRPYFQAVRLGSELTVRNGDPVSHNIHTYEIVGGRVRLSMFNVQQPAQSEFTKKIRMRRDRVIRLECDQHDFMIGWMYAVENPYYAAVGEDGSFTILDVPPGTHTLKAWHPYLGFQEAEVTVAPGGTAEVNFEYE